MRSSASSYSSGGSRALKPSHACTSPITVTSCGSGISSGSNSVRMIRPRISSPGAPSTSG